MNDAIRTRRKTSGVLEEEEEEEEESLFKADAVNEEVPERDRATQVWKEEEEELFVFIG